MAGLFPEHLIHMTVTYSNALLMVIITNVSDFAHRLGLPLPQPITVNQMQEFHPSPLNTIIGGWLTLTNGHLFAFEHGRVYLYKAPNNYFVIPDDWEPKDYIKFTNCWGRMKMTKKEVVVFARDSLRKLGYDPKDLRATGPPTSFEGPKKFKGKLVPQCQLEWRTTVEEEQKYGTQVVRFTINAETKTVIEFSIVSVTTWPPELNIPVPELEVDYQKRMAGKMYIRSNAPPRRPTTDVLPHNKHEWKE
jgi:hypothetical protein